MESWWSSTGRDGWLPWMPGPCKGSGPGSVACVILAFSQGNGAQTGRVIVGPLSWAW